MDLDATRSPVRDPATGVRPGGPGLSALDLRVLEFEARWWTFPGPKDSAIREQVAMTSVRYYALLSSLIDRPEALHHDPLLVRRLRRLRSRRVAERSARRVTDLG